MFIINSFRVLQIIHKLNPFNPQTVCISLFIYYILKRAAPLVHRDAALSFNFDKVEKLNLTNNIKEHIYSLNAFSVKLGVYKTRHSTHIWHRVPDSFQFKLTKIRV